MKIRFDSLSQFNSFSVVVKKDSIKIAQNKKLTKLVKGICVLVDGVFNIKVNIKVLKPEILDDSEPDLLLLPFTEDSYNIKGVTLVFDRIPNNKGIYTRYIRNDSDAKFHPGDPSRYVPFCNNWICDGYIVRRNGKLMFQFNNCLSPKGYDNINVE